MSDEYNKHRDRNREQSRKNSAAGRDIGKIPPVKDMARRELCRTDFQLFCETYFPSIFCLKWSDDHLKAISKIEASVLDGGMFSLAMPRGSGKSALTFAAAVWSLLFGHRYFVVLIAASAEAAHELLVDIKVAMSSNEDLIADFPEVCYPIQALEGESRRCPGQTTEGKRTLINWTRDTITLPTVAGSEASGSIIRVRGLTGNIRGMKAVREHDGGQIRPDLVLIDDPQTDASASSPSQCYQRENIIKGAVLGLAGPGKQISAMMPCTIIQQGDLADKLLDNDKHPEWQGEVAKLIYQFPKNEKLWEEYSLILKDDLRAGKTNHPTATKFYKKNKKAMDEGAVVGWAERKNEYEISALQHAMNLKINHGDLAFFAEYQNEPIKDASSTELLHLSIDDVLSQQHKLSKNLVPLGMTHVVCFVDVQKYALYYAVAAFDDKFSGAIIDYGIYPEQNKNHVVYADIKKKLEHVTTAKTPEGQIQEALFALTDNLCSKDYKDEAGNTYQISRLLIDSGYQTDLVRSVSRQSKNKTIILPSRGRGITSKMKPLNEYSEAKRQRGERWGWCWRILPSQDATTAEYDANSWKTFVAERLNLAIDDAGALTLFHSRNHQMIAEHLTSEYANLVSSHGRDVVEWSLKPSRDNHLLDCVIGCCVAASIQGCKAPGHDINKPKPKPKPQKRRNINVSF